MIAQLQALLRTAVATVLHLCWIEMSVFYLDVAKLIMKFGDSQSACLAGELLLSAQRSGT